MDGSFLDEKLYFKILGLAFISELDWSSYIFSIAKNVFKKIGALIRFMIFFLIRLPFITMNLISGLA